MAVVRSYYLDLVSGRAQGFGANTLRGLLSLLSVPYYCVVAVRNAYYDLIKRSARRFAVPVVSVGNIPVGGTGKTPPAAHVAGLIAQRGRRVAILLRGYKGRPIPFDDEHRDRAASRWRTESDEAMVLRRRCPGAIVVVNPDRVAGAMEAVDRGAEAIVLDDGFQHRRIARDLDLVLVDATIPFGHGHLLPRGLLREPTRSLRRAGMIVLTRSNEVDESSRTLLRSRLGRLSGGKPVITAMHQTNGFTDLKGHPVPVDDPTVMQAVLFAGIANFDSFRRGVERLGVHVLAAYQYPDHHDYSGEEIAALGDVAASLEANAILTTEKDAVKLVGRWVEQDCRLLVVRLDVAFDEDGEAILSQALDQILGTMANLTQPSS